VCDDVGREGIGIPSDAQDVVRICSGFENLICCRGGDYLYTGGGQRRWWGCTPYGQEKIINP